MFERNKRLRSLRVVEQKLTTVKESTGWLPGLDPFYDLARPIDIDDFENARTTVVIPTLNEEKNIGGVITELRSLGFPEILVIDGNSHDKTLGIAKALGAKVLNQNGKGKGAALRQAFDNDGLGDWIIIMDADGSMNPRELSTFMESLRNGADVVKGSRFMPGGRSEDMTFIRRIGNGFFVLLFNSLFGANFTDLCYGFAGFKRKALNELRPVLESNNFEIETEILVKAKKLGLQIAEVPSVELKRKNGKSNLNAVRDGFKILKTILQGVYT